MIKLEVGSIVFDDLTFEDSVIVEILVGKNGNVGYVLDSDYLEGRRYPWEITLKEEK